MLDKASSHKDLFKIAEKILKCMPSPIGQVCGPISTGGAGSIEENLKRFEVAIARLQNTGLNIFDQMPFEKPMHRIISQKIDGKYDKSILDDFYLPIFESGMVKKLYFLPDWESSTGAKWEHEQAKRLGIEIEYLS